MPSRRRCDSISRTVRLSLVYIVGLPVRHGSRLIIASVISTFTAAQNSTGGIGGGHGQMSHVASSYAAVLSIAMVGGEEAFKLIDRKAM